MAFLKALQNQTRLPEYDKLIEMTLIHKAASKEYYRIRKALEEIAESDPPSRLKLYDAQKKYSLVCKTLKRVQNEYAKARLKQSMEKRGYSWEDMQPTQIAKLMSVDIPMSIKDILEEERRRKAVENAPTGQMEEIMKAALAFKSSNTPQAEFTEEQIENNDPVDDFTPLPADDEEEN